VTRRQAAAAAVDTLCPRCGAARGRAQAYCVECGLRLPATRGLVPALRRRWLRRLGWYPGDWVWPSLAALALAGGGAAVAVALGERPEPAGQTTAVAPVPRALAPTPGPAVPAGGRTPWPAGVDGWTVVLGAYPARRGAAAAAALARRAVRSGLAQVGVLDSSRYASLHPGYDLVFSGVYGTAAEAQAALRGIQAAGFPEASTREIVG